MDEEPNEYAGLFFEWDAQKAEAVLIEHDIAFEDAMTVFADPLSWTEPDEEHSYGEERFVTIGEMANGKLVVVCHTPRGRRIRLISARRPTTAEEDDYREG